MNRLSRPEVIPTESRAWEEAEIGKLEEIGASKMEIWSHFENRANQLADQLWTIGTWIFGFIGAVLSLPFFADFVVADPRQVVRVESRVLTIIICVIGILLCVYAFSAVMDIHEHLRKNWNRANFVKNGKWDEPKEERKEEREEVVSRNRKLHGLYIISMLGSGAVIAFVSLILLACFW